MNRLTIDALKKEAIVELYNSAQFLEEFCAHMGCDTCVLRQACVHIVAYPKKENSMYYLMYDVKNRIKSHM